MSYLKKIEYEIIPKESFSVVRNCSGCGKKAHFRNTKRFRVNTNGNKLDVWLIYQCEKCKHTYNLTIYERQKVAAVSNGEYKCFLSNDEQLAEVYGKDIHFFRKNKAEVDFESVNYQLTKLKETISEVDCKQQILFVIYNPYGLRFRPERQIAELLRMSRSYVKKLMDQDKIRIEIYNSKGDKNA